MTGEEPKHTAAQECQIDFGFAPPRHKAEGWSSASFFSAHYPWSRIY
jgi:hypothetical protein